MGDKISPQTKFVAAFDNYLSLSTILKEDMIALLYEERQDQYWRRNFIRLSGVFLEGYAHCLREMCAISLECSNAPELTKKEIDFLQSERDFSPLTG